MNQQTKTYAVGAIGLVLVLGLIWWRSTQQQASRDGETIKIGVIGTLTRLGQYQGQQQNRGVEIARDEINAAGGINGKRIEFVVEDSQADPAKAVSAMRKLVSSNQIQFIIGDSWNSSTVPLLPIANENNVLLISPIAGLDQLTAEDMFFRTMPSVSEMMRELAEYAYNNLGARRVGVIRQESPYGVEHRQVFGDRFEDLGGSVVADEIITLTATDVRSELTKIASAQPDTILNLHASGPPIGLAIRQAKELGIEVNWLSHFGVENAQLLNQYGDVIEGLVYPYSYDARDPSPAVTKFVDQYRGRHNELPDLAAANAYDALQVLALAIEKVGENPSDVAKYLLTLENHEGASGTFSFDENGDVQKPILIKQVRDRQFVQFRD